MIMYEIKKTRYPIKKTLLLDFLLPLLITLGFGWLADKHYARFILQAIVDFPVLGIAIYKSGFYPFYVTWHYFLFSGFILFAFCGVSYRTARIPGPGRAFRRFWQGLLHRDLSKESPPDSFPPIFDRQAEKTRKLLARYAHSTRRVLGQYRRFISDIDADVRMGKKVERYKDFILLTFGEDQRYRHLQVVGNTGSGKSYSILAPLLIQDAQSPSFATVTLNPKADLYLLKVLATGAMRAPQKNPTALISFNQTESLAYDPLLFGDADALTKKIMNSSDITHPHFRPFQEAWLMGFFRIMRTEPAINGKVMLKQLYRYLKRPESMIDEWADKCQDADNLAQLRDLARTPPDSLSGLAAHIGCLVLDESLSHIFDNPTGRTLNVRDVISKAGNIYLDLDASSKGPQARALGRMIVMELQLLAGARQAGKERSNIGVMCFMDEFGSFAYNGFIDMLDKCRSSKMGFSLFHQSLGNLNRDNLSPSFKDELVDNTYQKIFLNLNDETAAWAARQMGARKVIKKSVAIGQMTDKTHIHGRDNQTVAYKEEVEPYAQPSDFTLPKGYGLAIVEGMTGQLIKVLARFGFVSPGELCSDAELKTFLERVLLDHPHREGGTISKGPGPSPSQSPAPEPPKSRTPKSKPDKANRSPDDLDDLIEGKSKGSDL